MHFSRSNRSGCEAHMRHQMIISENDGNNGIWGDPSYARDIKKNYFTSPLIAQPVHIAQLTTVHTTNINGNPASSFSLRNRADPIHRHRSSRLLQNICPSQRFLPRQKKQRLQEQQQQQPPAASLTHTPTVPYTPYY